MAKNKKFKFEIPKNNLQENRMLETLRLFPCIKMDANQNKFKLIFK